MSLEHEVIRQKMINQLENTAQYTQALVPEARHQLTTVVNPWFIQFIASDLYKAVEGYAANNNREITHLTDPIIYPSAPINLTDAYSRNARFETFANHVLSVEPSEPWKAEWRFGVAEEALWYTHLSLSQDENQQLLVFSRFPITSQVKPFAAYDERSLEIVIEPESFSDVIQELHPKVTIDLAEQILTGRVHEIAAGILKHKFVQPKKAPSYQSELQQMRNRYLLER